MTRVGSSIRVETFANSSDFLIGIGTRLNVGDYFITQRQETITVWDANFIDSKNHSISSFLQRAFR